MKYLLIFTIGFIISCALYLKFKKGYRFRDMVSPKRWRSVFIFLLKRLLKRLDGGEVYLSKNELLQYSYRVAQCTDCLITGNCKHCNCHTEGRMNNRTDMCSMNKFGKFLSDEDMNKILEENNVEVTFKLSKKNGSI